MKQEHNADQRDDERFLEQLALERRDRAPMRSLRSYIGSTTTPAGSPFCTSASFALTLSMVASAFWPNRITTMPPTASPRPSRSAMPRRMAGPTLTRPSSATRIGVPRFVAPTTTFSMSLTFLR